MFTANLVPGQGFQNIQIYTKTNRKTDSGRVVTTGYEQTKQFFWGIAAEASQREREEWKQNQHHITHTVVEYGAVVKAKATDYLVSSDGRKFYVQGANNAANLDISMIYYVEERFDMK